MVRFITSLIISVLLSASGWSAVILTWTAPGDNYHIGSAVMKYEIRYATHAITSDTWANATLILQDMVPKAPGSIETLSAEIPLDGPATYYFAVMAQDSSGNWSEVSNTAYAQYCPNGCVGIRGNINADPNESVDINDLLYFVDFFFNESLLVVPPCQQEADVDASGSVDISDLLFLVDYMFVTPAPVELPPCN